MNSIFFVFETDDSDLFFRYDWKNVRRINNYPELSASVAYYSTLHPARNRLIRLAQGVDTEEPLPPVPDKESFLRQLIEVTRRCYDPDVKNCVFFSMHCYIQALWAYRSCLSLIPWVEDAKEHGAHFEFVTFDCCMMSSINAAAIVAPITNYLVGCESASPNLGYLSSGLADILHRLASSSSEKPALKALSAAFIRRNDAQRYPSENLHYTDSVVLDLSQLAPLDDALRPVLKRLKRCQEARAEPEYKTVYDLVSTVECSPELSAEEKADITKRVGALVLVYRQSKLLRGHEWAKRLHGLSIGMGKNYRIVKVET